MTENTPKLICQEIWQKATKYGPAVQYGYLIMGIEGEVKKEVRGEHTV
jgi:hypothetical protein